MSARNWTPGPWAAVDGKRTIGLRRSVTAEVCAVYCTDREFPSGLAYVVTKHDVLARDVHAMRSADARLIAAAPSLYEALAATPCTCTTVAGASHGGQTEQLLDELCGRCAALRLAEGDEA